MTAPAKRKAGQILAYAPFAGGKRTLAKRIVAELGEHDYYGEPMVGGSAILRQKPRARVEVINDANPKIVNVLTQLRDRFSTIHKELSAVEFEEKQYRYSIDALSNPGSCHPWEMILHGNSNSFSAPPSSDRS